MGRFGVATMEQQQSAVHSGALGPVVSEHTKVTASLGLAGQPSQIAVHDRTLVGGDVDLAPTAGHQNTVNLILAAGDRRAVFTVHSALLCYYSPFFHDVLEEGGVTIKARIESRMLRREWRWESESDIARLGADGLGDKEEVQVDVRVKLPGEVVRQLVLHKDKVGDVGPSAVAAFVDWLYNGFAGFTLDGATHMKYSSTDLIKLWVFAGKIGAPACQNHCIEGIDLIRTQTGAVNTAMIGWVYENTKGMQSQDKLKRLLLEHCAWRLDPMWIVAGGVSDESTMPREALVHLLALAMTMMGSNHTPMTALPPFEQLEWRKTYYWIEDDAREN